MSERETRDEGRRASSLSALMEHAGYIFAGAVHGLGTTIAGVPTERAAVVRVTSPLRGPELLTAYVGRDVTVELLAPGKPGPHREAVFFASGLVYGLGLRLRELGHRPIGDLVRLRQEIAEAAEQSVDQRLRRRLADAHAVVAGRVVQTTEVLPRDRRPREHSPRWIEAIIMVDRSLRGARDAKSAVVLFVGSRHIAWRKAPKLHVGQAGVWILQQRMVSELGREVFVVEDPLDSWPPEGIGRIRILLSENG
jgi:hypothetical protein